MSETLRQKATAHVNARYWDVENMGKERIEEDRRAGIEDFEAGYTLGLAEGRSEEQKRLLAIIENELVDATGEFRAWLEDVYYDLTPPQTEGEK